MSRPLTGTGLAGVSGVPPDDWVEAGPRNASLMSEKDPIGPEGVAQRRQASRGADGQVETIENLFTPKQRHPTGPLFLESEQISEAVIVEDSAEENSLGADVLVLPVCGHELDMNSSNSGSFCSTKRAVVEKEVYLEGSRQSKIEYATILVPKDPCELSVQLKSSSSFSDEGNFSANNSVISGSIPSSLWDTDNRSSLCLTPMNQHISSSFNSSEGFSEASDREDSLEEEQNPVLDLYYLGQRPNNTITDVTSSDRKDETCPEAKPLLNYLSAQNENWNKKDLHENSIRLYMPQFRGLAALCSPLPAFVWRLHCCESVGVFMIQHLKDSRQERLGDLHAGQKVWRARDVSAFL
ncbi:LEPR protein, partial [Polypterus senegalus]